MNQLRLTGSRKERRLARLVARGGTAVHLVPDTILATRDILTNLPTNTQAFMTGKELGDAINWVKRMPLMSALQDSLAAEVQCQHCQPAEQPRLRFFSRSGSSAEGLDDLVIGKEGTSDFDIMLEFAGLRWAVDAGAETEPDVISPEAAPQMWTKPTDNPGFVTLHWVRTSRCEHEDPLAALPADAVRKLMFASCRALFYPEFSTAGPAVNVRPPRATDGGVDYVPCLRLPWWPEKEAFLGHHPATDFPPAATRRDICRFGVHMVPTGRTGSDTELFKWRLSFSRAEVIAVRHLNTIQHATITTVKEFKNILKQSGAAPALKSYFIKTAVLWLAQDEASDKWKGITAGVHMVLDWLEQHIAARNLPCFFWPKINLLATLSDADLADMLQTIRSMRSQAEELLLTSCEEHGYDLDEILGDEKEPLTELELRTRLARELVRSAVVNGTAYRPTAPCWESVLTRAIFRLAAANQQHLLWWRYRFVSGVYQRQCYLLQALAVAPADLVGAMQLTSIGGDMFTWPVTPLLNLLTESDLEYLLGDPAAVAAWCHQQLCRPPAERPAGLTAELDTPRGRAELLLQPELLLRALSEAVPEEWNHWQWRDRDDTEQWTGNHSPPSTFHQRRLWLEHDLKQDMESRLRRRLPELDDATVTATVRLWRQNMQHLLSGDRLRETHTAVTTRWPDRWQLNKYLVMDTSITEGETSWGAFWCRGPDLLSSVPGIRGSILG